MKQKPKMDLRAANEIAERDDPSTERYLQTMCDLTGLDVGDLLDAMEAEGLATPVQDEP